MFEVGARSGYLDTCIGLSIVLSIYSISLSLGGGLFIYDVALLIRCNCYTTVCLPLRGENPRALASRLSPVHADKPWYNYFILPSSV